MDVGIDPGDVCREDGDGLRDRDELSRLRLGGCLCHLGGSIVAVQWRSERAPRFARYHFGLG